MDSITSAAATTSTINNSAPINALITFSHPLPQAELLERLQTNWDPSSKAGLDDAVEKSMSAVVVMLEQVLAAWQVRGGEGG